MAILNAEQLDLVKKMPLCKDQTHLPKSGDSKTRQFNQPEYSYVPEKWTLFNV